MPKLNLFRAGNYYFLVILSVFLFFSSTTPTTAATPTPTSSPTPVPDPGSVWTQAPTPSWPGRGSHSSAVFDNKIWVMGGIIGPGSGNTANDVWYTSDGFSWTSATLNAEWSPRGCHTSVVFDGKIWVIGGSSAGYSYSTRLSDVWYSSDGANWHCATSTAPWGPRGTHTSVVFDGKMWVIGGWTSSDDKNDVWYSTDGEHWLQEPDATWGARDGHTSVVFDNKMWVIGGSNSSDFYTDVWYSGNGADWHESTNNPVWGPRRRHTSVVHDGRMWIIGGADDYSSHGIWHSMNGSDWVQLVKPTPYPWRSYNTSVVFHNRIWVIGGCSNVDNKLNDVWYSGLFSTSAPTITPTLTQTPTSTLTPTRTPNLTPTTLIVTATPTPTPTNTYPPNTPMPTPTPTPLYESGNLSDWDHDGWVYNAQVEKQVGPNANLTSVSQLTTQNGIGFTGLASLPP